MQFSLGNKERVGMCRIGNYSFLYDDPGPKEIDWEKLSETEKIQFTYNVKRGVLVTDKPLDTLDRTIKVLPSIKTSPSLEPIKTKKIEEKIDEDLKELRATLLYAAATIIREASKMPIGRIKKLLDLETQGKNRKGLKTALNTLLEKHQSNVKSVVKGGDLDTSAIIKDPHIDTSSVSDIIESEEEEINFKYT